MPSANISYDDLSSNDASTGTVSLHGTATSIHVCGHECLFGAVKDSVLYAKTPRNSGPLFLLYYLILDAI